jgi:hypothetical protein
VEVWHLSSSRRESLRSSLVSAIKNIAHLFSRELVQAALSRSETGPNRLNSAKRFEFIAALMMRRLYEDQWQKAAMIGFYLNREYADALSRPEDPAEDLLIEALLNGVEENHPIDFLISTYEEEDGAMQEFQLKRFGLSGRDDTEALITYLDGFSQKYAKINAACLLAIRDISRIDFPKVSRSIDRATFPFGELLLVGVHADKFVVVGLIPDDGWSAYDLAQVVSG